MVRVERAGVTKVERVVGIGELLVTGKGVIVNRAAGAVVGPFIFIEVLKEAVRIAWYNRCIWSALFRKVSSDIEPAYTLNETRRSLASFQRGRAKSYGTLRAIIRFH